MATHLSYEDSVKGVWKGLGLLAAVTLVEVALSLGKATDFAENAQWLYVLLALSIIVLSIYKAYFIVYEFMHMAYEVKGLALSILLPCFLLLWAIIAFFYEGDAWKQNRETIQDMDRIKVESNEILPLPNPGQAVGAGTNTDTQDGGE